VFARQCARLVTRFCSNERERENS